MDGSSLARAIRIGAAAIGAVALAAGVALLGGGGVTAPIGLWLFILGAVLVTAAAFEQVRYRARIGGLDRAARLQRTEETFEDPTSGARLRVWYDPVTGEREYRPEP
jgi:hypothetical protein